MTQFITTSNGRRLGYNACPGKKPGILFLGGFRSDMTGTKAVFLEGWARDAGHAFLRFDYSGHGQSSGKFEDGCIGDWADDAGAILTQLTEGPQVLVGSSMGGWIALLLARRFPDRVAGILGIAAAPDFTEDSMWPQLTEAQRAQVLEAGHVALPNAYDDTPYVLTRRLFEDGRTQRVLSAPLALPFPVRLLQGDQDEAVSTDVPLRLMAHAACPDLRLTLVKGADHRFSTDACLALIGRELSELIALFGEKN